MQTRESRKRPPLAVAGWRPGAGGAATSKSALLSEFLMVTESLPDREIAGILGIGVGTLRRWKRSPGSNLGRSMQERIAHYLAAREAAGG